MPALGASGTATPASVSAEPPMPARSTPHDSMLVRAERAGDALRGVEFGAVALPVMRR